MSTNLLRLFSALWLAAVLAAAATQPNIIFILADDLGYGDVQCLNPGSAIPTPHLDRLARQGMTFTDAHTPSAVCTPTRYGVVTGRYCWRSRLKRGVLGGSSPHLIDPKRQTIADLLKQAGYHTAVIGKWHLGLDWQRKGREIDFTQPVANGPGELGFDTSYLVPASLDMAPYVYLRDGLAVEQPTATQKAQGFPAYVRSGKRAPGFVMEETLDHLLEKTVEHIRERAGKPEPFFLYFPLTAPHKPVSPHPRFQGKTKLGPYGDFIVQVDWTVGQVLKALEDAGITDNTLIMFSSDNGSFMHRLEPGKEDHVAKSSVQAFASDHHTANHIYRGTKADIWEAGHRVALLARWPGKVKPGAICAKTVCLTDIAATAVDAAGGKLPANAAEDSFSFLPLLTGKGAFQRAPVIHHSINGTFAIRDGKWKLVLANGSGGREKPSGKPFARPYHLFDMSKDPSETTNLLAEHPEVAKRLEKRCDKIRTAGRSRGE